MDEVWFKDFGTLMDMLYHVMRNADDDYERQIKECYDELDKIYYNLKEEYNYKDASDEA